MNKITKKDNLIIYKIVERALATLGPGYSDLMVIIKQAHVSKPLRLQEWLDADDLNFFHDVYGIYKHYDIFLCDYTDFFVPRFQKGQ